MRLKTLIPVMMAAALVAGAVTPAYSAVGKKDTKAATAAKASSKKGKKATAAADTTARKPKKKQTAYQKFMKNVTSTAKGEFVDIYMAKGNKVYMGLPKKYLDREILAGGTIKAVSSPSRVNIGYKYSDPIALKVSLEDSVVVLSKPNAGVSVSNGDPALLKAAEVNFMPRTYKRLPLKAYSRDSSAVIFEITDVIKDLAPKGGMVNPSKDKSSYGVGNAKSFKDNASVEVTQEVELKQNMGIFSFLFGRLTVKSLVSFMLMPEHKMNPRVRDSRIGVFATYNTEARTSMYELAADKDGIKSYVLANRWRVEPSDTAAWLAGKKVPVTKPIVWYVDNTFPKSWIGPIKEGVLAWNAAFEKIGLLGAIEVRDFPTAEEDPEFDPDNLKYSCIRFVTNPTMNAMGPSWVDPQTGEILNASVLVYNDIIRLVNNWRFILTSQVDERVRARRMPQDVIDESMVYVISHEIGHTLGLMHNMAASAAYPVEKLRDPAFTAKYGTTPSIMDYARFNYIAQPGDKGVKLTPPSLGVYDEYVIEWLYKPVIGAKDMWDEAAIAGKLIDRHAGDPMYRYGPQQIARQGYAAYDPSARTEDLGDDPIKASGYGIANLKYILPKVNTWITDDYGYEHRGDLYTQAINQYYRYLGNVLSQVGGIYLNDVKQGTPGQTVKPVDKAVQKASFKWVMDQMKGISWINEPSLTANLPLHVNASNLIAANIAREIIGNVASNVAMAGHIAGKDGYGTADLFEDIYKEMFLNPGSGKELTSEEKAMQREIVNISARPMIVSQNVTKFADGAFTSDFSAYPTLDMLVITGGIDRELMESRGAELREIENTYGEGAVAAMLGFGESKGYFQRAVNTSAVDETASYRAELVGKVNKLARIRKDSAPAKDRAHYAQIYRLTKIALGE